ncbi:hypothetical protein HK405_008128, partial [Cladochytrium tenue]
PAGVTRDGQPRRTLETSLRRRLARSQQADALVPPPAAPAEGDEGDDACDDDDGPSSGVVGLVCVGPLLERAASGLVVAAKTHGALARLSRVDQGGRPAYEATYRVMVHGRIGAEQGLTEGDELAIEDPIDGREAVTRVRIIALTPTRNSTDGWLTTVDRMEFSEEEPAKFRTLREREAHFVTERAAADAAALRLFQEGGESPAAIGGGGGEDEADLEGQDGPDDGRPGETTPGTAQQSSAAFLNVAYVTGRQMFWGGLEFRVTPAVLVPRESTGTLVDAALHHLRTEWTGGADSGVSAKPLHILDLGTGSGCIMLSLLYALRRGDAGPGGDDAVGTGLDVSYAALEVARANRDALELRPAARFAWGSFREPWQAFTGVGKPGTTPAAVDTDHQEASEGKEPWPTPPVHLVVCNPPYLSQVRVRRSVDARRLLEEPAMALFPLAARTATAATPVRPTTEIVGEELRVDGRAADESVAYAETGYEAYVELRDGLREADERAGGGFAAPGCLLVLEVGHGMASRVRALFEGSWHPRQLRQSRAGWSEPEPEPELEPAGAAVSQFEFVELRRDARGLERCVVFRKPR